MNRQTDGWTDRRLANLRCGGERERAGDRNIEVGVSGTHGIPSGIGQQGLVAYEDSDVCSLQGQGLQEFRGSFLLLPTYPNDHWAGVFSMGLS